MDLGNVSHVCHILLEAVLQNEQPVHAHVLLCANEQPSYLSYVSFQRTKKKEKKNEDESIY
jgi:hypothetical protein